MYDTVNAADVPNRPAIAKNRCRPPTVAAHTMHLHTKVPVMKTDAACSIEGQSRLRCCTKARNWRDPKMLEGAMSTLYASRAWSMDDMRHELPNFLQTAHRELQAGMEAHAAPPRSSDHMKSGRRPMRSMRRPQTTKAGSSIRKLSDVLM